jgi:hypothetical protein
MTTYESAAAREERRARRNQQLAEEDQATYVIGAGAEARSYPSVPQLFSGYVSETTPDGPMVMLHYFRPHQTWGPCKPADSPVGVGDEVQVAKSDDGNTWIVVGGGGISPGLIDGGDPGGGGSGGILDGGGPGGGGTGGTTGGGGP